MLKQVNRKHGNITIHNIYSTRFNTSLYNSFSTIPCMVCNGTRVL